MESELELPLGWGMGLVLVLVLAWEVTSYCIQCLFLDPVFHNYKEHYQVWENQQSSLYIKSISLAICQSKQADSNRSFLNKFSRKFESHFKIFVLFNCSYFWNISVWFYFSAGLTNSRAILFHGFYLISFTIFRLGVFCFWFMRRYQQWACFTRCSSAACFQCPFYLYVVVLCCVDDDIAKPVY